MAAPPETRPFAWRTHRSSRRQHLRDLPSEPTAVRHIRRVSIRRVWAETRTSIDYAAGAVRVVLLFSLCVLGSAALEAQTGAAPAPDRSAQSSISDEARQERERLDDVIAEGRALEARIEAWGPTLTTVSLWISVFAAVMLIAGLIFGGAAFAIGGKLQKASQDADAIRTRLEELNSQFDKALAVMELRFSELPPGEVVGTRPQAAPQGALTIGRIGL